MMAAAVSIDIAQLLYSFSSNVVRKIREPEKNRVKEKGPTISSKSRTRRLNLTVAEKLQLRRQRNKTAAEASRLKAKHEDDILKERLFQLEYETMKLLLENEALKKRSIELEVENQNLKKSQISCHGSMVKENDVEATFKYAWFVNIPQQKEWVLPRIFFILIISMLEAVRQNALILNYWMLYINKQLNLNSSLKQRLNLACLPWMLMMHHAGYLHIPITPNG